MGVRSIESRHRSPRLGLAVAAILAVTFATCSGAQTQARPGEVVSLDESETWNPVADASRSPANDEASGLVVVDANPRSSDPWVGSREAIADSATPSCFGPHALSEPGFAAEGLLRMPLLVGAAASGACR